MQNSLNFLSTRSGFNIALRHFKQVNKFVKQLEHGSNLADLINSGLEDKHINQYQLSSILNALLVDKFDYCVKSFNLKKTYPGSLTEIADVVEKWTLFDLVVTYHHPQLGQIVINPKDSESWESIDTLKENELVVVYAGNFHSSFDEELAWDCVDAFEDLLSGNKYNDKKFKGAAKKSAPPSKKVSTQPAPAQKVPAAAKTEQKAVKKEAAPGKAASTGGKKKLSPRYGILVSNELFHNGNVEAWKKIIHSYQTKYSDIQVLIFYEGEQIHDINTLFKWGKVKHGTNIYFSLLGPEFKDISKLRRYLLQGASSRFNDFLKGEPGKVLALF